jgi:hypothetical protein
MAKVKIQGNASGTGVFTITPPATSTDRTLTLPDSAGTLVNTAPSTSGNVLTSDGTNWTSAAAAAGGATALDGLSDVTTTGSSVAVGSTNAGDTGSFNTALGKDVMNNNTSGYRNTALGYGVIAANTTGYQNVAVGMQSLDANTTGFANTAVGYDAISTSATVSYGTAVGWGACKSTTSELNDGFGYIAGRDITTGTKNTCLGSYTHNITTGSGNTHIGHNAGETYETSSNMFILGGSTIANLKCNDTSISSLSDQRDKAEITDLPESAGLDIINALRPVTYYWDRREWYDNNTPDGSKIKPDFRSWKSNSGQRQGFIAQEVESAISGHKYLEDSGVVSGTEDKKEFAPAHLLTNAIKAIQQLSAEVETLKAEVAILKGV